MSVIHHYNQYLMHQKFVTLTADIIIEFPGDEIILIKRKNDPYKGLWAIPGGIMDEADERIEDAALREAQEETGLIVQLEKLVGVYSKKGRDPRGRFVSAVFIAKPTGGTLQAADDAAEYVRTADFLSYELAFDHREILEDYIAMRSGQRPL